MGEGGPDGRWAPKVVLLGDAGVGKSALYRALSDEPYVDAYVPATVSALFGQIEVRPARGTGIRINLWDTAGQELYRSLTSMYTRDADLVLLCCDMTCHETFEHLDTWVEFARNDGGAVAIMVVGCKCDCPDPDVPRELITAYARKMRCGIGLITSAKTGEGILTLKSEIVRIVLEVAAGKAARRGPETEQKRTEDAERVDLAGDDAAAPPNGDRSKGCC